MTKCTPVDANGLCAHTTWCGFAGPEADAFALACWPNLASAGGFQTISQHWISRLPRLLCAMNEAVTAEAAAEGVGTRCVCTG